MNYEYWPMPLHEYMEDEVKWYMRDYEKERNQKTLEKKLTDRWDNAICSDCGRSFGDDWFINPYNSHIQCPCGSSYPILCPNCDGEMRLSSDNRFFECSKCDFMVERKTEHEKYS